MDSFPVPQMSSEIRSQSLSEYNRRASHESHAHSSPLVHTAPRSSPGSPQALSKVAKKHVHRMTKLGIDERIARGVVEDSSDVRSASFETLLKKALMQSQRTKPVLQAGKRRFFNLKKKQRSKDVKLLNSLIEKMKEDQPPSQLHATFPYNEHAHINRSKANNRSDQLVRGIAAGRSATIHTQHQPTSPLSYTQSSSPIASQHLHQAQSPEANGEDGSIPGSPSSLSRHMQRHLTLSHVNDQHNTGTLRVHTSSSSANTVSTSPLSSSSTHGTPDRGFLPGSHPAHRTVPTTTAPFPSDAHARAFSRHPLHIIASDTSASTETDFVQLAPSSTQAFAHNYGESSSTDAMAHQHSQHHGSPACDLDIGSDNDNIHSMDESEGYDGEEFDDNDGVAEYDNSYPIADDRHCTHHQYAQIAPAQLPSSMPAMHRRHETQYGNVTSVNQYAPVDLNSYNDPRARLPHGQGPAAPLATFVRDSSMIKLVSGDADDSDLRRLSHMQQHPHSYPAHVHVFPNPYPPPGQAPAVVSRDAVERATAVKYYIERKFANIHRRRADRLKRQHQLELEMNKADVAPDRVAEIRAAWIQEESHHLRRSRKRMDVSDFMKLKNIGRGAFGEVTLVRHEPTGKVLAMKEMSKMQILLQKQMSYIQAERDVLAEADNEWVVRLFYAVQDPIRLYFVMEFVPGGDLLGLLMKVPIFSESIAQFYLAELVMALASVHSLGFIHRDIKPDNILIGADGHIKLTDFGLCTGFRRRHNPNYYQSSEDPQDSVEAGCMCSIICTCDKDWSDEAAASRRWSYGARVRSMADSLVGTPNYIAPEVFQQRRYDHRCDWWSLGVIFYEMVIGYPPFVAPTPAQTREKVVNWRTTLKIPSRCAISLNAKDLIMRLCCDASDRIGTVNGVREIQSHVFFEGISWDRTNTPPFIPQIDSEDDTRYFHRNQLLQQAPQKAASRPNHASAQTPSGGTIDVDSDGDDFGDDNGNSIRQGGAEQPPDIVYYPRSRREEALLGNCSAVFKDFEFRRFWVD